MSHNPGSAKPTVTRDDVARLAGVSNAVVSYVVNESKRVSPQTDAKVREAIAMLGYRPNQAARALRLGSSETFGMIVPDSTNPFFAALAHAVEVAAVERGYELLNANADGSLDLERRHIEHFATRRVDGVFVCSAINEPDLRALLDGSIPVVLLNHATQTPGVDSVGVDLQQGARLAVEHLAAHGHRSIGLVMGTNSANFLDGRETGWRDTLAELGLPQPPVLRERFSLRGGYEAGKRFVETPDRPDALFVSSDRLAIGLLRAVHEHGLRVPEDVAIVAFDGSEDAEFSWPPLASVSQPIVEMARAAVEALADNHDDKRHRTFAPTLIPRASCGCPAPTAT